MVFCSHCSTGPLCPLFLLSSVLTVQLVLCTHCSSGPLYPLFLWSSVPTVPLVLCTHCSTGPLYPLFHCSTGLYCSTGPHWSPLVHWIEPRGSLIFDMNCWWKVTRIFDDIVGNQTKRNRWQSSLSATTFFTYSNIYQLWRILLRHLLLIFVSSLPRKLISITLQSHLFYFHNRTLLLS